GNNNTIQLLYNVRYNNTENLKRTLEYDSISGTYSIIDPNYNKSLYNDFVTQTYSIAFNSVREHYDYTVGFNVMPSYTRSANFIKGGGFNGNDSIVNNISGRMVYNFSPKIDFRYRFNSSTNMRFEYRGTTKQPSVTQLDPTQNVTNPLNIREGNPDLLPSFTNRISFRFNNNKRATQRSLSANASFSFTTNEIINFTEYEDKTGIQTTRPVNENGSWNASGDIMYNTPVGTSKKFKFNTRSSASYNNKIGFTKMKEGDSERNIAMTTALTQNLGMSYNKNWFYGQLRANIRYSNTGYSIEGKETQTSYNYGLTYNTQIYLPQSWTFASDVDYRANRGLTTGYNKDEILWNASLSKQFLSKKQATLRLQWNDILQQRLNISRNVSSNYIEDSEYNTLTSYFMLSFIYRFNTMDGKGRGNRGEKRNSRIEY
ncbi:MAG: outer membrane beta-barrel family protein, partial [Tannerella sp.]|nr:outer membrane beta-barrel family protein [Tannerella sp.]